MQKEFVVENDHPLKIKDITFGLLSAEDMMRLSELHVCSRELYQMPTRTPAPFGAIDKRLGISDKASKCQTCDLKLADCAGHYGYIKLELPVFHIGYFKHIVVILQNICKTCSGMLLPVDIRPKILKQMRGPRADVLRKIALRKKVTELCKKVKNCPSCGAANGPVKKVAGSQTLKIIHEPYKSKQTEEQRAVFESDFSTAMGANKDLATHIAKAQDDMNPLRVRELFMAISDEDCELLWCNPDVGRPECLLLQTVLVPPVAIRPSVTMDAGAGSNEDDLTVKLQEIITYNNALRTALRKGASMNRVMENWDFLQVQVAQYINAELPGLPRLPGAPKPIRGLCQRLKGKAGRFRGNLSGKRVDFSARTVISPDPNLRIDQVGVPVHVAKIMTYPERVCGFNLDYLKKCVINGPEKYPGANAIRQNPDLVTEPHARSLLYGDRKTAAKQLKIGDIVDRHMKDGDIVLFNRQPSLHKMSIMAHKANVMPWRTFRFNECVCAPYNADFDGDEMNMHLPQTEEARSEALELMGVHNNLITPRNGEPLVAANQDFLTATYLLTQKNLFLGREEFCQLVSYFCDALEEIDLPIPAILWPCELWTGKQVFGLLIRPNQRCRTMVNMELAERNYSKNDKEEWKFQDRYMCCKDGYVCFRNSELLSGNLCKKTLGTGDKKGLVYLLIQDHGNLEAARVLNRLAKLAARWLGVHKGFSIGIDDVTPSQNLQNEKVRLMNAGYEEASETISAFKAGTLQTKPGCNLRQSMESDLNRILSNVREANATQCMSELPFYNNPRIMAECGSKGSTLNISQMVACLGQQSVSGSRIPDGFTNRALPHFEVYAIEPAAKGFVRNSFYSGLTATEFFFHTMGGREGLVDTAVKTAETGYMARRLMKALEDLSAQYDSSVRNSEGNVVQFIYGDDGLNPARMETASGRPCDLFRVLDHEQALSNEIEGPFVHNALSPTQMRAMGRKVVARRSFQILLPKGAKFLEEVSELFDTLAARLEELHKQQFSTLAKSGDGKSDTDGKISKQWRDTFHELSKAARSQWRTDASVVGSPAHAEW
jgi:DNA-directed RNA polymerase III subunit RPC1